MVMMVSSLAQRAATGRALAPAAAPRVLTPQTIRPIVLRRYKEGEQADTSGQGSKAPRNPLTGQRLTPVSNPQKEGYQATEQIPQSEATSARINQQLGAQPGGRPFGGKWSLTWRHNASPAEACLESACCRLQWVNPFVAWLSQSTRLQSSIVDSLQRTL